MPPRPISRSMRQLPSRVSAASEGAIGAVVKKGTQLIKFVLQVPPPTFNRTFARKRKGSGSFSCRKNVPGLAVRLPSSGPTTPVPDPGGVTLPNHDAACEQIEHCSQVKPSLPVGTWVMSVTQTRSRAGLWNGQRSRLVPADRTGTALLPAGGDGGAWWSRYGGGVAAPHDGYRTALRGHVARAIASLYRTLPDTRDARTESSVRAVRSRSHVNLARGCANRRNRCSTLSTPYTDPFFLQQTAANPATHPR